MLRKGPEQVPDSMLVFAYSFGLLILATFMSGTLLGASDNDNMMLSFFSSLIGYALYWVVLSATGFARRLIPTIASIMGCGSILTILMVAAFILLGPFLGTSLASVIVWLILIWSVPVKGHIIARAIERHWYIGIVIAMIVFVLQYVFYQAITSSQTF